MNYIVFDLEWNQPIDHISKEDRKLQFEILEIGAVKLDENRNKIAEFSQMIKPQVYKKLNWHTQKMLNISWGELKKGYPFPDVMKRFLKWCGKDPVFCTWGTQDLTELQRNMNYYKMQPLSDGPIQFLNIQKIFANHMNEIDKVYNLELAVDTVGIEKDIPFHRAFADAYYTAKIFKLMDEETFSIGTTYDLYHIPKDENHEIKTFDGKTYYYVSSGYINREDITGNRRILTMQCPNCNYRNLRPKIRWFSSNSKLYFGAAICPIHGTLKGRLRVKHSENGLYYIEKYLSYAEETAIDELREYKLSKKKKHKSEEETNASRNNKATGKRIKA